VSKLRCEVLLGDLYSVFQKMKNLGLHQKKEKLTYLPRTTTH
jgi:hypothetical protein